MDYSFQDQLSLARQLVRLPQVAPPAPDNTSSSPLNTRVPLSSALLVVSVIALIGLLVLRRAGRRPPHPASRFLDELETRLKARGVAAVATMPLEELSATLIREGHPLGPAVSRACRRYLEARFTNSRLDAAERRALLAPLETSNG